MSIIKNNKNNRLKTPPKVTIIFLILAWLPLLLIGVGGVSFYLHLTKQAENEALSHASNAVEILSGQTSAFINDQLRSAELLAHEKSVIQHLLEPDPLKSNQSYEELNRYCKTLHASLCYILTTDGLTIGDNQAYTPASVIGFNYAFRPYFTEAMKGRQTLHLAIGVTTLKRGLYFSSPVVVNNQVIGVAVIKFSPLFIENAFKQVNGIVVLTDENGIVFASNHEGWRYKSLSDLSPSRLESILKSRQFGDAPPKSIGLTFSDESKATAVDGKVYYVKEASVQGLNDWTMTYFIPSSSISQAIKSRSNQLIGIGFALLFVCTSLAAGLLYRKMNKEMGSANRYREELERSEDRLQMFAQLSEEAILIQDDGKIIDANIKAESLFGYTPNQFSQTNVQGLFTPDSIPALNTGVHQTATTLTNIPVSVKNRIIQLDDRDVEVFALRDISAELHAQQQLVASEHRFKQLYDLVAEGILIHKNCVIVDVNQAICRMLGYSRLELLGSTLDLICTPESFKIVLDRIEKQATDNIELTVVRKNGTQFPIETSGASIEYEDGIYRVVSIRDISRQKSQEERILYQAQYDFLTDLPNRMLARDRIEHAIKTTDRKQSLLALLFIDLDDFKKVNDNLGHDMGDKLLVAATERLIKCVRESDTLARHGGDEFLILLENLHDMSEVEIILEKILSQFSQPFNIDNNALVVTTSIGVAFYPYDSVDYQSLMQASDIAMYQAKASGRNTFHFYTPGMNDKAMRQLEIDNNIRNALERDEFTLFYQALFADKNETEPRMVGAEVLLRWNSETLGPVAPDEFIPLTEQTGLIIPIGRWVLLEACKQAKAWMDQGHPNFRLSVNVSPRQFRGNDFVADLAYALETSRFPARLLTLEVTEGLLIQTTQALENTLQSIVSMGISISMDDFGTGYSSLSYLKTFPFNNLKIDRSFINELNTNNDAMILVTATIAMAHELGLTVTAEGIETAEQLAILNSKHCDYLQGYLLAKPMDSASFQTTFFT